MSLFETTYNFATGELTITKYLGEESYAVVRVQRDGSCMLYEIPQYGGEERAVGKFANPCLALDEADKWT